MIQKTVTWSFLKKFLQDRPDASLQYVDFVTYYSLYAIDGIVVVTTDIQKNGNKEETDFVTNYLNTANASPVVSRVNVQNQINSTPTGLNTALRPLRITVTDTPTKLPNAVLSDRNTISVRVLGTSTVYFGNHTVTHLNGYPKFQFEEVFMDIKDNPSVDLYAVCAPGESCEVAVLEIA